MFVLHMITSLYLIYTKWCEYHYYFQQSVSSLKHHSREDNTQLSSLIRRNASPLWFNSFTVRATAMRAEGTSFPAHQRHSHP